eukprot:COSAG03_NODE_28182_length_218_cov_60.462185_1_plen_26_part_10
MIYERAGVVLVALVVSAAQSETDSET